MLELYISTLDQTIIWPLLIVLGLLVGFIGGLYGVGGFLLTPFLKVFFGLSYPVAVGCSLTIVFINSILTTQGHWKKGRVNIKLALVLALGAIPGTEIGVRINQLLRGIHLDVSNGESLVDPALNISFIILMVFVMVSSIMKERNKALKNDASQRDNYFLKELKIGPFIEISKNNDMVSIWGFITVSFLIGITTGLLGIGGGILFFPALTYLFGVSAFSAVGTAAFERIFVTSYGAGRYLFAGDFNVIITLILFAGSFIGVKLGLKTAYGLGDEKLRKSFLFILVSGIIVVLYDIYKNFC